MTVPRMDDVFNREALENLANHYQAFADTIRALPEGLTRQQVGEAIESTRDTFKDDR